MPAPDPAATTTMPIGSDADLAWVRHRVRQCAAGLGFGLVQQTKLVTAASELARNTLVHGGGGQVEITPLADGPRRGIRLAFTDSGPGIGDVDLAMTDGYSSACGLGLGLGGARRLVDELTVDSRAGQGAVVTVVAWLTGAPTDRTGRG
ncbi:anti-sigma regulatory factor [Streptomyces argyrophyllae]|uniref:Anti-sigma regulatory factor n=1 Tax=Streptomyces argyrophylli TaxID=2726118 RepID=A0A6M4PDC6_9ACTN|nr:MULTISPECIES: anti-sigma regulatory factor [Streptomyces]QJS08213.1 anti-sigma regulatory factor [Streptomyces argyrophyllae]